MIICIDVGNTHIFGGVFVNEEIKLRFRYPSTKACTSDTFGIFLQSFLELNHVDTKNVEAMVVSSVVPSLEYSIVSACKKYFSVIPLELKPGVKTGLNLNIKNPIELGADRVANAVAAVHHFQNRNLIVVDYGTATTICAISNEKAYLGGAILPGIKLSLESLSEKTAKLFNVEITHPDSALGKTTVTQLQSGLIYGQLGAVKEITQRIIQDSFKLSNPFLVATGGYAYLFENEKFFNVIVPDLVLHGLRLIWEYNKP